MLRRTTSPAVAQGQLCLVRGKLTIDLGRTELRLEDRTVKLTATESKLLYVLMKSAGKTLSSENISQELWGKQETSSDRLRTYIRKLRDKLNDKPPRIILTERGEGYRFISPS